jgi:hypothetical protein
MDRSEEIRRTALIVSRLELAYKEAIKLEVSTENSFEQLALKNISHNVLEALLLFTDPDFPPKKD